MKRLTKTKAIVFFAVMMLFITPCLLVLSEGESLAPNIIGYAYILSMLAICKFTRVGSMIDRMSEASHFVLFHQRMED